MKLKEFDILLDIKKNKQIENIEIVQNDFDSNILNITLVEDYEDYDLSGLDIEVAFAKSDGTTVLQDMDNGVEILGNKIVCKLKTNTIASPGKVYAEVRLLEGDKLLTSARFNFFVRKAIVNDETIESTNEFPILDEKIKEVNDLIEEVQGMEAIKGDDGKSAYEVWLDNGNTGTIEEYLASLKGGKGDKGDPGLDGKDGKSAYEVWIELGNIGTQEEFIESLTGPQGKEGKPGKDGTQGIQGIPGKDGKDGEKGDPGTSLKILGNYGTLEELKQAYPDGSHLDGGFMIGLNYYYWGLQGWENAGQLQGPNGKDGKDGENGVPGIDGKDGLDGKDGSDANVTDINIKNALGYTPASEDDIPTKTSELQNDSGFITSEEVPAPPVLSVNTKIGDVVLSKDDIGLPNVDNVKQMPISGGTFTDNVDFDKNNLIGANLVAYTERISDLGTSTTPVINLNVGNVFRHMNIMGTTHYSIENQSDDSSIAQSFTLIIRRTTGTAALIFPSNIKWSNGEVPDMTKLQTIYVLTFIRNRFTNNNWLGMFGGEFNVS